MLASIQERLAGQDWPAITELLWQRGYALTSPLFTPEECGALAAMYSAESLFRSRIVMARYRFGSGEYKYFDYPLPPMVQDLREYAYPYLADLANGWNDAMGQPATYPKQLAVFLAQCKKHKQVRPTPLLLHYETGDYNCLHQDLYGEIAFPFQMACFLNRPGVDYTGGEFVLVEQQPRAQSRPNVIQPDQGQSVIFTTRYRPVKGSKGYYRVNVRHGVSALRSGTRNTLGIIFHDAE